MAFIEQEKKRQPQGSFSNQPLGFNSASAPFGGGSQGAGSSQAGAGGGGLFSNIQSYLGANQGADSSGVLKDEFRGSVGQDYDTFKSKADEYEQKGATNYGAAKTVLDRGAQSIDPLKSAWSKTSPELEYLKKEDRLNWRDDPSLYQYDQAANAAANYQYKPQDAFSYNMSNQARQFGDRLKDDNAFKGLMSELYGKRVGSFTPGQSLLQNQLDSANPNIGAARNEGLQQYEQFGKDLTDRVGSLNQTERDRAAEVGTLSGAVGTNYNNLFNAINQYESAIPDLFNASTITAEDQGSGIADMLRNRAAKYREALGLPGFSDEFNSTYDETARSFPLAFYR